MVAINRAIEPYQRQNQRNIFNSLIIILYNKSLLSLIILSNLCLKNYQLKEYIKKFLLINRISNICI